MTTPDSSPLNLPATASRRSFLLGAGAVVVAGACGSGDGTTDTATAGQSARTLAPAAASTFTAADFDGLPTCVLLPEQTAGPFPLEEQFDRRDITEGLPGHPLRLGFRVVDDACGPVPAAAVEIWHTDATGDYSAFTDGGDGKDEGEGTTFMRGTQTAGDAGIVEFLTIVPGWYSGRAVHIHLRAHLDGAVVLTSQLYFDADQVAEVYREELYAEFGPADTSNETDGIAGDPAADGTLLTLAAAETDHGTGSVALLNLGVDPTRT